METIAQDHHQKVLSDLKEKYNFSKIELEALSSLKNTKIHKIFYCSDGGFDKKTGEYDLNKSSDSFKVKINYEDNSNSSKWLYFIPNKTRL